MEGISEYHGDNGDYDMELIVQQSKRKAQGTPSSRKRHELPSATGTRHLLKLEVSESLLSSVGLMLAWFSRDDLSRRMKQSDRTKRSKELSATQNQLITSARNSKEVPTELPLRSLFIGDDRMLTRTAERDMFTRFCYLAKKIVCQMRFGALSSLKVDIPFSDITALHVCFDDTGSDYLRIEAKGSFRSFYAVNTRPGKYIDWIVDQDPQDATNRLLPEADYIVLELEKGMLEKGFAKLLYADPRLERLVLNFSSVNNAQMKQPLHYYGPVNAQMQQPVHYYYGRVNAHLQQTNIVNQHCFLLYRN